MFSSLLPRGMSVAVDDCRVRAENPENIEALVVGVINHLQPAAACRRVGVVKQTQFCHLSYVMDHWGRLPEAERRAEAQLLMPSLVIDSYLCLGPASHRAAMRRSQQILAMEPTDYDGHIELCRASLQAFRQHGGRSIKLLAGYRRPLRFEEVPDAAAAKLFARGVDSLSDDESRRLQDNLLWRVLEMAVELDLPLVVHAGYSNPTCWTNSEQLQNLLTSARLSGLKVDLCHAGWPNHAGAMVLTRTYRNCYFNLCWMPVLSAALGRRMLSEAIDMLPRNKILIGSDCGTTEAFVGAARLIRSVCAEVLAEKVDRGQFSLAVARELARAILYDNAMDFYGLDRAEAERAPQIVVVRKEAPTRLK